MILEAVASGGCLSYPIGCPETCAAALIDPEPSQIDRYLALAARDGLRIHYLVATHTHADHFSTTQELATTPRLQVRERSAFVDMMNTLNLTMPTHVTEALRTNMSGRKTVAQMLSEAAAAVPFMSMQELRLCAESGASDAIVRDVRERDAYDTGHIPGAHLLPRGQKEP